MKKSLILGAILVLTGCSNLPIGAMNYCPVNSMCQITIVPGGSANAPKELGSKT